MKLLMCLMLVAVALGAASAGYIHKGWYPSYSSPIVYSRPVAFPSYYSGWSGNNGWNNGGWNRGGWKSGWNSGWW
ncbi:uncharacterized protein LOC125068887 [Vanessa atalanta]|uniref:uncharacterized protein LOC125068887 n=1 Tax=Vanessa atalanta TaxID=42275 RepID=UPI001FCD80A5|nr:uncharacterized protein LOC125068887 [Vanessa atalanta]